jgi:hypothetical protein
MKTFIQLFLVLLLFSLSLLGQPSEKIPQNKSSTPCEGEGCKIKFPISPQPQKTQFENGEERLQETLPQKISKKIILTEDAWKSFNNQSSSEMKKYLLKEKTTSTKLEYLQNLKENLKQKFHTSKTLKPQKNSTISNEILEPLPQILAETKNLNPVESHSEKINILFTEE